MQFKYPEILYALFLLLIPIFIHLFQLRKFEKVAFTNVDFLKRIDLETRKSAKLKHFLILLARLGIFTALIIAFAQPYFSTNKLNLKPNTVLYIDNSLSMQAKTGTSELLIDAVQKIISSKQFSNLNIITNDAVYKMQSNKEINNQLLSLEYSPFKKDLQTVLLQASTLFKKNKTLENNLILISDFQATMLKDSLQLSKNSKYSFVQLLPNEQKNISIDSAYITKQNGFQIDLEVVLNSYQTTNKNLSVSLFNGTVLVGKTTCNLEKNTTSKVNFNFPFEEDFNGRITIEDNLLSMDNELFFCLNKKEKINVLAIGEVGEFLSKIYTKATFNFGTLKLNQVNYDKISEQNLIVLNELKSIPLALQKRMKTFVANGGSLVIIPNKTIDIANYNQFFTALKTGRITEKTDIKQQINSIIFSHPLWSNVFEKKMTNFQYPTVNSTYTSNFLHSKPILEIDNKKSFVSEIGSQKGKIYWFSSAISTSNSNFKSSPLIVPVFYNFGMQSYQLTELYYIIGSKYTMAVKTKLENDAVLHIENKKKNVKFIPLQEVSPQKVTLSLENNPVKTGFYTITKQEENIKNVAFNYPRIEGEMNYADMRLWTNSYKNAAFYTSVPNALENINNSYKITSFWKWLILAALFFLILEIFFLRFL